MSKATNAGAPQRVDYNDAVAESKRYFEGDDLGFLQSFRVTLCKK